MQIGYIAMLQHEKRSYKNMSNNKRIGDITTRYTIEEKFHNEKAIKGVDDFYRFGALEIANDFSWSSLGHIQGKALLEIGCGDGTVSIRFAQAGAQVTAIDISGEMIERAKQNAKRTRVEDRIKLFHMSAEDLSFPDNSFDLIYGHSILHHLNLEIVTKHLVRLLRPNGIAVFLEPLDYNPILNLFRRLTPHRRTPTEKPLNFQQLEELGSHFTSWEHHEFYLVSLIAFIWYYGFRSESLFRKTLAVFQPLDRIFFALLPFLRQFAWVSVIKFNK